MTTITIEISDRSADRLATLPVDDIISKVSELLSMCDCQDQSELLTYTTYILDLRAALREVSSTCKLLSKI